MYYNKNYSTVQLSQFFRIHVSYDTVADLVVLPCPRSKRNFSLLTLLSSLLTLLSLLLTLPSSLLTLLSSLLTLLEEGCLPLQCGI